MQTILRKRAWSPYAVGALIGVLSWFAFASANKPLGITTAFENTAALLNQQLLPDEAAANSYYSAPEKSPKIDWEWMLVAGVFLGSMLSARLSGDHTKESAPALWRSRFGSSVGKRYAAAFLGGAVMMFGARVAQGCTSGHGISGALQLAVSSWIFVVVLFAVAVATTFLLYGQKGGAGHV
jgi:uncharacterized membrane protein YedE/YeeE